MAGVALGDMELSLCVAGVALPALGWNFSIAAFMSFASCSLLQAWTHVTCVFHVHTELRQQNCKLAKHYLLRFMHTPCILWNSFRRGHISLLCFIYTLSYIPRGVQQNWNLAEALRSSSRRGHISHLCFIYTLSYIPCNHGPSPSGSVTFGLVMFDV